MAGNPNDTDQFAWFFRYDATAIAHLRLPALVTTAMNAPQGVNVMWNTFMLLPGVLLAPVTLLFGPQSALTVFLTAGFAGSATAMFACLRRWHVSTASAALGGAVYGFSPALLHSAIGHYDLLFAVFPPLIVDAGLRLALGRVSAVRGGLWLGLLATAQLLINEEILFDTALAGVIVLTVLAASRPRAVLDKVRGVAGGLAVAAAVMAAVAGYPLWVQFFGPLAEHGSPFTPDFFKADLSSFVVPSSYLLFHTAGSAAAASRYQGHLPEYLGYLGWPLLIVLAAAAVGCWRRLPVRAAAVTCAVLGVFSLGGTLLFGGHEHPAIKLPWYWLQGLPLLGAALPDRFSILADGAAAALLAFAADAAVPAFAGFAARRWPRLAFGWRPAAVVLSCAVLAVLPIVPRPLPAAAAAPLPPGWTAVFASLRLPASASVLVVPIPMSTFTEPLRWQADTQRTGHDGRRLFHGADPDRAWVHRRQRHAGRRPLPERDVAQVGTGPAQGAGRHGPGQRVRRVGRLCAGQRGDQRRDARADRGLAGAGRGRGGQAGFGARPVPHGLARAAGGRRGRRPGLAGLAQPRSQRRFIAWSRIHNNGRACSATPQSCAGHRGE